MTTSRRPSRSRAAAAALLLALLAAGGPMAGSRAAGPAVLAWGSNADGQLGPATSAPTSATPVAVEGLGEVVALAAGAGHSLALRADGTVWAWGRNAENELGDGHSVYSTTPPPRPGPSQVYQRSEETEVTPPTTTEIHLPSPVVTATPLSGVRAVAAGWFHSLALKQDGTVWAWGDNACGQLGNGRSIPLNGVDGMSPPTAGQVPGLSGVVAVAAGRGFSLALDGTGTPWAWGDDRWGQLGSGQANTRSTCTLPGGPSGVARNQSLPTKVAVGLPVLAMAAGSDHALALTDDGSVWSWGNNCAGQLGPGPGAATSGWRAVPVPVSGLPTGQVVALAAGGPATGGHSLALTAAGGVLAWGRPDLLGAGPEDGAGSPCHADPLFASLPGAAEVAGAAGQRARIDPVAVRDPTAPSGALGGVVALQAGAVHTLAVRADGVLFAWGRNDAGQLGPAGVPGQVVLAATRALDGPVAALAAASHSLALPGPPPARPAPAFAADPGDLPVDPGDLPIDPGSVVPDDPTGLLPVGPGDLPIDPDDPPGSDDLPVDPGDVPGDPDGLLPGGGPIGGTGGGVFVTGSLADLAAGYLPANNQLPYENYAVNCTNWGCNPSAAQHFLRRAIAYAAPGDEIARLLVIEGYVPVQHIALNELGFSRCKDDPVPTAPGCFELAYNDGVHHPFSNDPSDHSDFRGPPDRDLRTVSFGDYDAVLAGSGMFLADLDVLVARQQDLGSYVNAGGGVVAFSTCSPSPTAPDKCLRGAQDQANPPYEAAEFGALREIRNFDYLPFLTFRPEFSERFRYQSGASVTPEGRKVGLSEADVVGTVAEGYFTEPCGFDPLVRSAEGFVVTMATHKPIPTPCVGAQVPDVRVQEGDGGIVPATFQVSLGQSRGSPVRVDYTTAAGGATAGDVCPDPRAGGADYLTTSGTLTFPAGSTGPLSVSVPVCGDRLAESDETFALRLTSPDDPGLEVTATGTIVDDDSNPPGGESGRVATPGGGDRGENASQGPAQPASPVQVPAPAPGLTPAPAPAVAAAPAVAVAPALAPAPAPAPATSQAQAQQGAQSEAQQGAEAQAPAASPAPSGAASPQAGMATDEQRQRQVATARVDTGPDELLATGRQGAPPTMPLVAMAGAATLALGLGSARRRPARQRAEQAPDPGPEAPQDRRLLRRVRGQR